MGGARKCHQWEGNGVAEGRAWRTQLELISGQNSSGAFCVGAAGGRARIRVVSCPQSPLLAPPMPITNVLDVDFIL